MFLFSASIYGFFLFLCCDFSDMGRISGFGLASERTKVSGSLEIVRAIELKRKIGWGFSMSEGFTRAVFQVCFCERDRPGVRMVSI